MSKQLPKDIAVTWDDSQGKDNEYMMVAETPEQHADGSGWKRVGLYRLVDVIEVRQTAEIKRRKVRKSD